MAGIFRAFASEFAVLLTSIAAAPAEDPCSPYLDHFADVVLRSHMPNLTQSAQFFQSLPLSKDSYDLGPDYRLIVRRNPTNPSSDAPKPPSKKSRSSRSSSAPAPAPAAPAPASASPQHCYAFNWKGHCATPSCARLHAIPVRDSAPWTAIYNLARRYHGAGTLNPVVGPPAFLQGAPQPSDLPSAAN